MASCAVVLNGRYLKRTLGQRIVVWRSNKPYKFTKGKLKVAQCRRELKYAPEPEFVKAFGAVCFWNGRDSNKTQAANEVEEEWRGASHSGILLRLIVVVFYAVPHFRHPTWRDLGTINEAGNIPVSSRISEAPRSSSTA